MEKYITRRQKQELKAKKRRRIIIAVIVIAVLCIAGCIAMITIRHARTRLSKTNTKGSLSIVDSDQGSIPDHSGADYVVLNGGKPNFNAWDLENITGEHYSNLDSLGRCGVAYAMLDRSMMPTEERGEIGQIKPTGWVQEKYEGIVDSNPPYLYNRSHLIAYALTGQNANELNLITGTRYMNTEGMLPYEEELLELVESTGFHVLYRVTPIFEGKNLLASGVLMEAKSVEDSGKSLQFCVYAYNVQPGIGIDYATGENWPVDGETEETTAETSVNANKQEYVLNLHTQKFHYPNCPSVSQMKQENRKNVTISREKLLAQGYVPCGSCHP